MALRSSTKLRIRLVLASTSSRCVRMLRTYHVIAGSNYMYQMWVCMPRADKPFQQVRQAALHLL